MNNLHYTEIDLKQGTEEWLAFRKGKIGSSMAAAIKGIDPWKTKLQLWEQISLGTETPKNWAMERGIQNEEKARLWANFKLKMNFEPKVFYITKHPLIIASVDGFYVDAQGKVWVIEIKNPGMEAHLTAIEGNVPKYYYPQLQHIMMVLDIDEIFYLSFYGEEGVILTCHRDKKYCEDLLKEELDFLNSVSSKTPPSVSTVDWIDRSDDETLKAMCNKYFLLSSQIKDLETLKEETRLAIVSQMSHPRTNVGDYKVQYVSRKGNVDYEKILKDYKVYNVDSYRGKSIESWRITYDK